MRQLCTYKKFYGTIRYFITPFFLWPKNLIRKFQNVLQKPYKLLIISKKYSPVGLILWHLSLFFRLFFSLQPVISHLEQVDRCTIKNQFLYNG